MLSSSWRRARSWSQPKFIHATRIYVCIYSWLWNFVFHRVPVLFDVSHSIPTLEFDNVHYALQMLVWSSSINQYSECIRTDVHRRERERLGRNYFAWNTGDAKCQLALQGSDRMYTYTPTVVIVRTPTRQVETVLWSRLRFIVWGFSYVSICCMSRLSRHSELVKGKTSRRDLSAPGWRRLTTMCHVRATVSDDKDKLTNGAYMLFLLGIFLNHGLRFAEMWNNSRLYIN